MTVEALFLNGVHESVLKGIIDAQERAGSDEIFYLQPYKSQAIAEFRQDPPTACRTTILYLSVTDNLPAVSYRARIVGWKDKTCLDELEWDRINAEIRRWGYNKNGLFVYPSRKTEKKAVNLLCIQQLRKLKSPFSVSCLIKTKGGEPLSPNRKTSGGWSYVAKTQHKWDTPPDGFTRVEGGNLRIEVCLNRCGAMRKAVCMDGQFDYTVVHCHPNPIPDECKPSDLDFDYGEWIYPKHHDPFKEDLP